MNGVGLTIGASHWASNDSQAHATLEVWEHIDVLVLPTTPRVPTLTEVTADPFGPNEQLGHFTTFANLLDLACIVVRRHRTESAYRRACN